MSRVAKKPIQLAKGVELLRDGSSLTIKGPKGSLSTAAPAGVSGGADAQLRPAAAATGRGTNRSPAIFDSASNATMAFNAARSN